MRTTAWTGKGRTGWGERRQVFFGISLVFFLLTNFPFLVCVFLPVFFFLQGDGSKFKLDKKPCSFFFFQKLKYDFFLFACVSEFAFFLLCVFQGSRLFPPLSWPPVPPISDPIRRHVMSHRRCLACQSVVRYPEDFGPKGSICLKCTAQPPPRTLNLPLPFSETTYHSHMRAREHTHDGQCHCHTPWASGALFHHGFVLDREQHL